MSIVRRFYFVYLFLILVPSLAHSFEIGFKGFGSLYYGQAFSPYAYPSGFKNDKPDFTHFSLIGLNVSGAMTDEVEMAAQLVASGNSNLDQSNFTLFAQWAFLTYRPNDSWAIQAGRQLYPIWQASEFARVGYLMPFRQIPSAIYGMSPFVAFDGVSVTRFFPTTLGRISLSLFTGNPLIDPGPDVIPGHTFELYGFLGTKAILEGDGWRVAASASTNATKMHGLTEAEGHTQNYSAGYRFDKYKFVSWAEYGFVQSPDGSQISPSVFFPGGKYIGRSTGGYALLGYRIGKFMPRYTFARSKLNIALVNSDATTHTVGINYNVAPQIVIKAEYERDSAPGAGQGSLTITQATGAPPRKSADAIYVGADFIF